MFDGTSDTGVFSSTPQTHMLAPSSTPGTNRVIEIANVSTNGTATVTGMAFNRFIFTVGYQFSPLSFFFAGLPVGSDDWTIFYTGTHDFSGADITLGFYFENEVLMKNYRLGFSVYNISSAITVKNVGMARFSTN
jgi:hypothetical protein